MKESDQRVRGGSIARTRQGKQRRLSNAKRGRKEGERAQRIVQGACVVTSFDVESRELTSEAVRRETQSETP